MIATATPFIVNIFGGPGVGKSTLAAGLYHRLKVLGHSSVELVTEHAKDLTWEGRDLALANQLYVLGEQLMRLDRLAGKVRLAITDSPVLLANVYARPPRYGADFRRMVREIHRSMPGLSVLLERHNARYEHVGRNEDETAAADLDRAVRYLLLDEPHLTIPADTRDPVDEVIHAIRNQLHP